MNREMFEKTLDFIKDDLTSAEFWQLRLLLFIYDRVIWRITSPKRGDMCQSLNLAKL